MATVDVRQLDITKTNIAVQELIEVTENLGTATCYRPMTATATSSTRGATRRSSRPR